MIQSWLEASNLQPVFTLACLAGVLITVYVMQTTWMESEGKEHSLLRWFRRIGQLALAASFLWMLSYAYDKNWQPWPSMLALVLSADLMLLGRAMSVIRRPSPEILAATSFQNKTLMLFLFVLTVGALITGGMLLDRGMPYERSFGEMIPSSARAGESVSVRWMGDKKRDCPGLVHRVFIDSAGTYFGVDAVQAVYAQTGPGVPVVRSFVLPRGMACGPALYIARTEFYCNPLQRLWPIVSNVPPVKFTISC